jgi:hypothetical protein
MSMPGSAGEAKLCRWSGRFREAFEAVSEWMQTADVVHFGIAGVVQPRIVFEKLADLARLKTQVNRLVTSAEPEIISARQYQPYRWRGREFTCALCAAFQLGSEIEFSVVCSMCAGPGLTICLIDNPESDVAHEWHTRWLDRAKGIGLLDAAGEPTTLWNPFRQRYLNDAAAVNWTADSARQLEVALTLEAQAVEGKPSEGTGRNSSNAVQGPPAAKVKPQADQDRANAAAKRKQGRPRRSEQRRLHQTEIASDWQRFYESKCWEGKDGTPKAQFCKDRGIEHEELETALRRARERVSNPKSAKKRNKVGRK